MTQTQKIFTEYVLRKYEYLPLEHFKATAKEAGYKFTFDELYEVFRECDIYWEDRENDKNNF